MSNFSYFLSGRTRSDYKHISYLKKSLSNVSTAFPKLANKPISDDSCGFFMYGYLGANYQLIRISQCNDQHLFIFDNPAIRLPHLPVVRVHQKNLKYANIPKEFNTYYLLKFNCAKHYFESFKSKYINSIANTRIENVGLIFDKSYPLSILVDYATPDATKGFDNLVNSILVQNHIISILSRKNPYIYSVSRLGLPSFTSSNHDNLLQDFEQPSHVFAFQSTAVLKYLFDTRVHCSVSEYNPFYLDDLSCIRLDKDFISLLSHRFAVTHFFFEEIIEYSKCLSH